MEGPLEHPGLLSGASDLVFRFPQQPWQTSRSMSICVLDTQAGTTLGLSQFLSVHHDLLNGTPLAPVLEPCRVLAPAGWNRACRGRFAA